MRRRNRDATAGLPAARGTPRTPYLPEFPPLLHPMSPYSSSSVEKGGEIQLAAAASKRGAGVA